jgi:cytidine deaminase
MDKHTPKHSLEEYLDVLRIAKLSHPDPKQSNFYVLAAGKVEGHDVPIPGGNHEYAITDAAHAEETVIDRILELFPGKKIEVIGFYGEGLQTVPASCGNCRDRMREIMTEDSQVIAGSDKDNLLVVPFKSLLKEDFAFTNMPRGTDQLKAIEKAHSAYAKSYDIYTNNNKIYGAAILTDAGIFVGGFEGDVAYDPTLALRTAVLSLKYSSDNPKRFKVKEAFIVGGKELLGAENSLNTIPYKDRQQFLEFVYLSNIISGKSDDNPVPITIALKDYANSYFYETNSNEWLPHPFHPKVLGMDKELEAYVKRIIK